MPARTISAMYAASFSPRPRSPAASGVIMLFACRLAKCGPPNGTPSVMCGKIADRLY
jgi:hypothetical protein